MKTINLPFPKHLFGVKINPIFYHFSLSLAWLKIKEFSIIPRPICFRLVHIMILKITNFPYFNVQKPSRFTLKQFDKRHLCNLGPFLRLTNHGQLLILATSETYWSLSMIVRLPLRINIAHFSIFTNKPCFYHFININQESCHSFPLTSDGNMTRFKCLYLSQQNVIRQGESNG